MLGLMWKVLASGEGKRAALDSMLAVHDAKVQHVPGLVEAPGDAPPRNSFTSRLEDHELSISQLTFAQRRRMLPTMAKLSWNMNASANFYKQPLASPDTEAPEELFEQLEAAAAEEGATHVRYVKLPDDVLFGGLGVPHRNAIVYTVQMDKETMDTAPSFDAFLEVAKGYGRLARIGNRVTRLLRGSNFDAYPGTALGGLTDYCRVAELAGLGTIGYHGCVITPDEGALLRINTIYTSIENLPERDPQPTAWVRDFCSMCRKCVRACPPQAIYETPKVLDNGRAECIETATCLDYFAANFGCAVCIDVCPFTQSGYAKIEHGFKGADDAPRFDLVELAARSSRDAA